MKTPREILLERHRRAEASLDQVRMKVLASLKPSPHRFRAATDEDGVSPTGLSYRLAASAALSIAAVLRKPWLELIWPSRRAWAGMAALWLAVLAANLDMKVTSTPAPSVRATPNRELVRALEEQRRLLAELLPPFSPAPIKTPPPSDRPRSERTLPFKEC
jgi:hypothetical protein